jgi:hypothetical protein
MDRGTRASLLRHGFPLEAPRVTLLLKPTPEEEDAEHKHRTLSPIGARVIACFDNEPSHLMALVRAAPNAMHVFCDTIASEAPAAPGRGLHYLREYPAI